MDSKSVQHEEKLMLGIFLVIISTLLLSFMGFCARLASPYISTGVMVFWQCLTALILLIPVVIQQKTSIRTKKLGWHFIRAITGTGAWFFLYKSIALLGLTTASLLLYSSPLLVPIISHFILHVKVRHGIWGAVLIGFVGIILVLNPLHQGAATLNLGVLYGIIAAVLMAVTQFSLRELRKSEATLTILLYYLLLSTLAFGFYAAFGWQMPHKHVWGILVVMGILMMVSQFTFTCAYRFASPVHLGAFIYLTIVFSALLDCIFLGAKLSTLAVVGIIFVIMGGFMVVRLEANKSK